MKHSIRRPQLRITSKGIRISRPHVRIGGKAGLNVSSQGISASVRGKGGSLSTRKGCRWNVLRWLGLVLGLLVIGVLGGWCRRK